MESKVLVHVSVFWLTLFSLQKTVCFQVCVCMILLTLTFNLGLLLGFNGKPGPVLGSWTSYNQTVRDQMQIDEIAKQQPQRTAKSVDLFKKTQEEHHRVPFLHRENSGVVYDCVTREPLNTYDPEMVKKNYQTVPKVQGLGETDDHRQQSFIDIYNEQTWGGRDRRISKEHVNYKASGPGSALERSQGVIAILHTIINELKTQLNKTSIKILDLPCGDLQYMSYFLETRTDINYTGADIVPALIAKHTERYKGNKHVHFKKIDIVKDDLKESYDIILCRMMLQHLVFKDVLRALYHFSKSNSTYLATTTFSENKVNNEVTLGDIRFRHLNLEKPPVNLSPPLCNYKEPPVTDVHYMAIWKLPLLQHI